MANYHVHVEGMVSRIITVEAENQEEANELAKEEFISLTGADNADVDESNE
jgi:hypothetical protein